MSTQIQRRRGTTTAHNTFTGVEGELTVDTTKDTVVVHDGATTGGHPLMREDGSNSALALGSASSPSLKWDPNTGIYSPGADQVAISTNGTGRLFVGSSGGIGVGTATINSELQFTNAVGTTGGANKIRLYDSSGTVYGIGVQAGGVNYRGDSHLFYAANGTSEYARIDSSGRLGLGTSSPNSLLQLGSGTPSTSTYIAFGKRYTTSESTFPFIGHGASADGDANSLGLGTTSTNGAIKFYTGPATAFTAANERLRITNTGNVGIGTTAPSSLLDLSAGYTSITWNNDDWRLRFRRTDGSYAGGIKNNGFGDMSFWTADTERARIDSSGRLLVGTSSAISNLNLEVASNNLNTSIGVFTYNNAGAPKTLLSRANGTQASPTAVTNSQDLGQHDFRGYDGSGFVVAARIEAEVDGTPGANDMPGRLVFSTTADGASSPTERMRISSDGSVTVYQGLGIGAAPVATSIGSAATLSFTGGAAAPRIYAAASNSAAHILACLDATGTIVTFRSQTTTVGSISVTGSATAYNTSSDYRLKENVVPLIGAIDRLNQLQVHRFNFIADPDTTVDGFIAHEAQAVVPECVTGTKDEVDADGNPVYQGIDQSKLVPLLTAALQEALQKIEDLEGRLTAAGL